MCRNINKAWGKYNINIKWMNGYTIAAKKLIFDCLHARDSLSDHLPTTLPYWKLDLHPGNKYRFKYASAFMLLASPQHAQRSTELREISERNQANQPWSCLMNHSTTKPVGLMENGALGTLVRKAKRTEINQHLDTVIINKQTLMMKEQFKKL